MRNVIGTGIAVDPAKLKRMEKELGCTFREDGEFAEMALCLQDYSERTLPVPGVRFGIYQGDMRDLRRLVALVDEEWCRYFWKDTAVFCGFAGEQVASFCILDENVDCAVSSEGMKVGSIGCVGTLPEYRRRGIGLRMVDLAALVLRDAGCDVSYIHYTHIDEWYGKLGYRTFARFSFPDSSVNGTEATGPFRSCRCRDM